MNFAAKLMRMATRSRRQGSKEEAGAATAPAFLLPQDVLASILVRLPGSDLRRLRRVCREWRDTISDPRFIHEHMVYRRRPPPTHTIVFFPGSAYGSGLGPHNHNGRGFLFDEHWRLQAELTAGRSDKLIGACNGLLCFLEINQRVIKIVEPFTGESLVVPQPAEAWGPRWAINAAAYCFGFDATAGRYKIVHHNFLRDGDPREGEAVEDEELHVYTVGVGEGAWTRVHVATAVHGQAHGGRLYIDGTVYWPSRDDHEKKLVRFDPATGKITSAATVRRRLDLPTSSEGAFLCRQPVDSTPSPCVVTCGSYSKWDAWFPEAQEGGAIGLPGDLVLLSHWSDHGLYIDTMERSLEFGQRKLLFAPLWWSRSSRVDASTINGQVSFVPACRRRQLPVTGAPPSNKQYIVRTIGYDPTVSAAPLALYLGTPSSNRDEQHQHRISQNGSVSNPRLGRTAGHTSWLGSEGFRLGLAWCGALLLVIFLLCSFGLLLYSFVLLLWKSGSLIFMAVAELLSESSN